MALKTFKPYTKSTRGTVLVDKSGLWKGNPFKPLTVGQASKRVSHDVIEWLQITLANVFNVTA